MAVNAPAAGMAPVAPRTLEDARLPEPMLIELLLRHLSRAGELRAGEIAWRLGVALSVIEPTLDFLRGEKLVEVPRRGSFDADVAYALARPSTSAATSDRRRCRWATT